MEDGKRKPLVVKVVVRNILVENFYQIIHFCHLNWLLLILVIANLSQKNVFTENTSMYLVQLATLHKVLGSMAKKTCAAQGPLNHTQPNMFLCHFFEHTLHFISVSILCDIVISSKFFNSSLSLQISKNKEKAGKDNPKRLRLRLQLSQHPHPYPTP